MAQPIYKAKNGKFSAAIFENQKGKTVALQKSYTDKDENWQHQSISVFPADIDKLIVVLEDVKQQLSAPEGAGAPASKKTIALPGGDELIIEEEEIADEGFRSEMEELIEIEKAD